MSTKWGEMCTLNIMMYPTSNPHAASRGGTSILKRTTTFPDPQSTPSQSSFPSYSGAMPFGSKNTGVSAFGGTPAGAFSGLSQPAHTSYTGSVFGKTFGAPSQTSGTTGSSVFGKPTNQSVFGNSSGQSVLGKPNSTVYIPRKESPIIGNA